ncbi:ATP-dependent Clp protease, putative [Talaromyces stipitatus ATCC 10500]|uniref:ATP-dependent Clp protease, putative n=1 Tax=Talaromyces stipitatus (strain ATCC 10500 / CBS 375.48 / QM 6759 / NRRL 1006) TaxID=441959 RepID=B8LZ97_TALSN|nr:ATP-dependent Clp protease, putative [Talaromyces stipitatus ATCC 10500]EED21650.1 ATP-dependent Clp protease, putative [Talaromyces stipitatus ATCC 10500]
MRRPPMRFPRLAANFGGPQRSYLHTVYRPWRIPITSCCYNSRSFSSISALLSSSFNRSDFTSQPFTGSYEAGLPTSGPLGSAPAFGAPRLTPRMLKQYLDQYVVGQDRAKKILSVAVYNHYQRIMELQRQEEAAAEAMAQKERREAMEAHPLDSHQRTIHIGSPMQDMIESRLGRSSSFTDTSMTQLEKSNILLLGPSGVGKTLMAKTLARVLDVPFSMSDCTPFTQAGYIGEDADVCVHRLLAAANYDVEKAERGIICLDEVDKIATARVSHGKDVSGEGVQQALLKIVEGTTIQVQVKPEKNSSRPAGGAPGSFPPGTAPGSGFNSSSTASGPPPQKGEVYNVRTDNILFIFSGAFVGLNKIIMDRISKSSMGFGQPVRASSISSGNGSSSQDASNETPIPIAPGSEEEALYKKYLPFFTSATPLTSQEEPIYFNPLDLSTPADLQKYGFIPELVGRIPVTTALSSLSHSLLLRILTEPRNSLITQYETLFDLSGIKLSFTTPALHKIASNALTMGTGARALRTELETILSDAMFEAPGSSVKFVLVTENVADRQEKPIYFGRGQGSRFHSMIAAEESDWENKMQRDKKRNSTNHGNGHKSGSKVLSFAEYRNRASTAG